MNKQNIRAFVSAGRAKHLTFKELRREARRRFGEKAISQKDEGNAIERMPRPHLIMYVNGKHPHFS